MLQRSVERRAAGVVAQQDRAAVAQSHNRQVASRLQVAVAMAVLLTGGKGSVGDARMVHDFARSGPSTLSLSLPRFWNIQGRSAGCLSSRRDSRVGGSMVRRWQSRMELAGWLRVLLAGAGLSLQSSDLPLPTLRLSG